MYDACVILGPPPSYDSVFKRAKAARQDSSNPATYLKSVLEILSHTSKLTSL